MNLFSQDTIEMDSILIRSYNFHISNNKIYSEADGFTKKYVNQDSTLWISKYFAKDSILKSKEFIFKNEKLKDSIRYSFNQSNKIDSSRWFYDIKGRETKYTWYKNDTINSTLNWFYEYSDSIIGSRNISKKTSYRVDISDFNLDTCCYSSKIQIFENNLLISEIEYDSGDTTVFEYQYDDLGNIYFYKINNELLDSISTCFSQVELDFPNKFDDSNSDQINQLVSNYVSDFFHIDCKSENMILTSKNKKIELEIHRGNCHSSTNGNIRLKIIY